MNEGNQSVIAYLATLSAIVLLAIGAAIICITFKGDEGELAKVIAALAFIGGATTGLIGVIGTFRPKGTAVAATTSGDVNVNGANATTGDDA